MTSSSILTTFLSTNSTFKKYSTDSALMDFLPMQINASSMSLPVNTLDICVMSHNTLVTYTDKNSEPMLARSNLHLSNCKPFDKLCPVPSLVTHPDNPWFQVLSCTLRQTLTNSESCHMLLSHALVTHPRPSTPALILGTSNNTQHPWASIPTSVFWASTNTQWTSGHLPRS